MSAILTNVVNPDGAQMAYEAMLEVLTKEEFKRGEVVCALVVMLGTQYHGEAMDDELTARFTRDLTQWLTAYFHKGTVQ